MEEIVLTAETVAQIIALLQAIDNDGSGDDSLYDGKLGNNDIEKMLMYDDKNSAFAEISSRLEVIDTRLHYTNTLLADGFGFVVTFCTIAVAWNFLTWLYRSVGV